MNQLNFSIRVRVPVIDMDRAKISQRKVMAILRSAFKGALRDGSLDVTMWDSYGQCLAHWDSDPRPYRKQTLTSCFKNPLSR